MKCPRSPLLLQANSTLPTPTSLYFILLTTSSELITFAFNSRHHFLHPPSTHPHLILSRRWTQRRLINILPARTRLTLPRIRTSRLLQLNSLSLTHTCTLPIPMLTIMMTIIPILTSKSRTRLLCIDRILTRFVLCVQRGRRCIVVVIGVWTLVGGLVLMRILMCSVWWWFGHPTGTVHRLKTLPTTTAGVETAGGEHVSYLRG